jgi:hypothetical protein
LPAAVVAAVRSLPYIPFSVPCGAFYFLAFVGPSILFDTGSLTASLSFARTLPVQLTSAIGGSSNGFAVGLIVVFYMPMMW